MCFHQRERFILSCLKNTGNEPSFKRPLHPPLLISQQNNSFNFLMNLTDPALVIRKFSFNYFILVLSYQSQYDFFSQSCLCSSSGVQWSQYRVEQVFVYLVLRLWLKSRCTQDIRQSKQVTQIPHRQTRTRVYLFLPPKKMQWYLFFPSPIQVPKEAFSSSVPFFLHPP